MIDFIKEAGFPAIALLLGGGMLLLAIIRNIALEKMKIQLTSQQSLQLGIVGVLFIVGGFVLQYYPPNAELGSDPQLVDAQSTLSLLQTRIALPTSSTSVVDSATSPSTPSLSIVTPGVISTPTALQSPVPTLTSSVQSLAELFCANFYSILIRTGPGDTYPVQSILKNPNNLSNPDCLVFDFRMPDNSWMRIAPNQGNGDYSEHELGWVVSNQFRPTDFEKLRIYIPENIQNGLYCVTSRYGLNVRTCPADGCRLIGTLELQDCLILDARTADGLWVRISNNQTSDAYAAYRGNWASSYFIAPFEFTAGYQPYFRYYFELLPVVAVPTPEG